MARTPLLSRLQALSRLAGNTPDHATDFQQALSLQRSRREVLKAAGVAGMVVAGGSLPGLAAAALGGNTDSLGVAVIGAGLAGLASAYELKKSGSTRPSSRPRPASAGAASAIAAPSPDRSPRTAAS
jgi:hypothetical protein